MKSECVSVMNTPGNMIEAQVFCCQLQTSLEKQILHQFVLLKLYLKWKMCNITLFIRRKVRTPFTRVLLIVSKCRISLKSALMFFMPQSFKAFNQM